MTNSNFGKDMGKGLLSHLGGMLIPKTTFEINLCTPHVPKIPHLNIYSRETLVH